MICDGRRFMRPSLFVIWVRINILQMIKNLIFDFGGVVADLDFAQAIRAFESIGVHDAAQRLDCYLQSGIFYDLEAGAIDKERFCQLLGGEYHRHITVEQAHRAWMGYFAPINCNKLRTIERLHDYYRIFLLSNTNPFVMDWADSESLSEMRKPLSHYFDRLYCSYRIGVLKPDRRIFDYLSADAGIEPSESLFVDDGAANVASARELGFHTLQPLNGEDWSGRLFALLNEKSCL